MIRICLIGAALVFAAASSPAYSFSKCRLSLVDCSVVLEDLENLIRADIRDDLLLSGLPVSIRNERSKARQIGRVRQLFERHPSYIAAEISRMKVCMMKDDTAALQGKMLDDPRCK